jgi:hypothetical protein
VESDNLIEQLCTAAGIIMEDASPIALVRVGNRTDRIRQIARAGREILALAEAASALAEHQR